MTDLLACNDLTVRFGGLVALDGFDFSIGPTDFVGLVGPNGSGKTTFFNAITGLYRPVMGAVRFNGSDLFAKAPQHIAAAGIARTFQRSRLMLDLSVFDNIALGAMRRLSQGVVKNILFRRRWHEERERLEERMRSMLNRFNPTIARRLFEPVASFTMIDRRRIELCRALIGEPRLLLLDEPSAGMTHNETRRLMDEVVTLQKQGQGLAVVLVEHEMDVVQRVSDRCVALNFGRKIYEGDFAGLIADAQVQQAYLGTRS